MKKIFVFLLTLTMMGHLNAQEQVISDSTSEVLVSLSTMSCQKNIFSTGYMDQYSSTCRFEDDLITTIFKHEEFMAFLTVVSVENLRAYADKAGRITIKVRHKTVKQEEDEIHEFLTVFLPNQQVLTSFWRGFIN